MRKMMMKRRKKVKASLLLVHQLLLELQDLVLDPWEEECK